LHLRLRRLGPNERFGERLSENPRGLMPSCTSMTRRRFCAGPFGSRELRFGRLPPSCEVPPKRRCHFRTTTRNSPTASRRTSRQTRWLVARPLRHERDPAADGTASPFDERSSQDARTETATARCRSRTSAITRSPHRAVTAFLIARSVRHRCVGLIVISVRHDYLCCRRGRGEAV